MTLNLQVAWLFLLAIPVASVAWTVTHEELFREPREYCDCHCQSARTLLQRKFFYIFTCEYCFSHYVAAFFVVITGFQFLITGWRGYLIGFFALVWVANVYMSVFGRLRLGIKKDHVEIKEKERETADKEEAARPIQGRPAA